MKKIEAIIKPFKREAVKAARHDLGSEGLASRAIQIFGRQRSLAGICQGREYSVNFLPMLKLKPVFAEDQAAAVDIIIKAAKPGKTGDGKGFFSAVAEASAFAPGKKRNDAV